MVDFGSPALVRRLHMRKSGRTPARLNIRLFPDENEFYKRFSRFFRRNYYAFPIISVPSSVFAVHGKHTFVWCGVRHTLKAYTTVWYGRLPKTHAKYLLHDRVSRTSDKPVVKPTNTSLSRYTFVVHIRFYRFHFRPLFIIEIRVTPRSTDTDARTGRRRQRSGNTAFRVHIFPCVKNDSFGPASVLRVM